MAKCWLADPAARPKASAALETLAELLLALRLEDARTARDSFESSNDVHLSLHTLIFRPQLRTWLFHDCRAASL